MNDTSHEAEAVQMRLLRAMPPERRLAMAVRWSTSLREMIRAKLRQENPEATEAHVHRLLADRWLGAELAARIYGPINLHG